VAGSAFQNLTPGQTVTLVHHRNWNGSSPAEGEFPSTYRLMVGYDPDIFINGNPKNDDCVNTNNRKERSGAVGVGPFGSVERRNSMIPRSSAYKRNTALAIGFLVFIVTGDTALAQQASQKGIPIQKDPKAAMPEKPPTKPIPAPAPMKPSTKSPVTPVVQAYMPRPARPGALLTLTGRNFGKDAGGRQLRIEAKGYSRVLAVTQWTPTQIAMPLPPDIGPGTYAIAMSDASGKGWENLVSQIQVIGAKAHGPRALPPLPRRPMTPEPTPRVTLPPPGPARTRELTVDIVGTPLERRRELVVNFEGTPLQTRREITVDIVGTPLQRQREITVDFIGTPSGKR
jgi:hypothetical protein